jgi:hypothetical protein
VAESDISPAIRDFITEQIDSVLQLEVLLLLFAHRSRAFTIDDITKELKIDANWLSAQLARLCSVGILVCMSQSNVSTYQYQPAKRELDEIVQGLADAYAQRRVSVVSLIFNKPTDRLRHFADAFRIRKDRDKEQ